MMKMRCAAAGSALLAACGVALAQSAAVLPSGVYRCQSSTAHGDPARGYLEIREATYRYSARGRPGGAFAPYTVERRGPLFSKGLGEIGTASPIESSGIEVGAGFAHAWVRYKGPKGAETVTCSKD